MSVKKRNSGVKLVKTETLEISQQEYDEMPEWPDEAWDRAEIAVGDRIIRPATGTLTRRAGRPKSESRKQSVHLRLSPDVLDYFRSTGPGWQTRIDQALRKAAKLGANKG